jgi:hypothetical protein
LGVADEEADAWAVHSARVGGRSLSEDDVGAARDGEVCDDAEVEGEAADADRGCALGLAGQVGDVDALRAQRLGDADWPLAADMRARGGILREDVARRDIGGIEATLQGEAEALMSGGCARLRDSEASELRDDCLTPVDGKAHGNEGRNQGYCDQSESTEHKSKNALHRGYPLPLSSFIKY